MATHHNRTSHFLFLFHTQPYFTFPIPVLFLTNRCYNDAHPNRIPVLFPTVLHICYSCFIFSKSTCTVFSWLVRPCFLENNLSQNWHLCGRSFRCTLLMCRFKQYEDHRPLSNTLPHILHVVQLLESPAETLQVQLVVASSSGLLTQRIVIISI